MKKLVLSVMGLIVVFIVVLIVNTMMFSTRQVNVDPITPAAVDSTAAASRLSQALQIKTISHKDPAQDDPSKFIEFREFLEKNFPLVHQNLKHEVINDYSLLYTWKGRDPSLKPILLNAHMDVVPIEPGTESNWNYDAFSGAIEDGYVWGRGALDMKSTLTAIMEAVEGNLKKGVTPKRTVYLSMGHDEELGGANGAGQIAAHLKSNGIRLEYTIDEGMPILDHTLSPVKQTTALIGVAEKGYMTLKITAETKGGHSSMPPLQTTLGILSKAIVALEENQMPASYSGAVKLLFDYLGPEMPFVQKMLFANDWFFESVIVGQLEKIGVMNASMRTTTAPTVIEGGVKENVLPSQAHVLVNFRILPGNTPDDVLAHARQVIDDPDVKITAHTAGRMPSPVASVEAPGFKLMQKTTNEVFPDTLVAPGLMIAGTDTKHFVGISDNSYRHYPIVFGAQDTSMIHGTNERIAVDAYVKMIQYFARLFENISM